MTYTIWSSNTQTPLSLPQQLYLLFYTKNINICHRFQVSSQYTYLCNEKLKMLRFKTFISVRSNYQSLKYQRSTINFRMLSLRYDKNVTCDECSVRCVATREQWSTTYNWSKLEIVLYTIFILFCPTKLAGLYRTILTFVRPL